MKVTVASAPCVPTPPQQTFRVDAVGRDVMGVFSSPALTTRRPGELLLAFVSVNGPAKGVQTVRRVTGGGLSWTLVQRDDATSGTSEIWQAYAATRLGTTRVAVALAAPGQSVSLSVAGFSGARATPGAAAHQAGKKSGPRVFLTPRASGSQVWAVGRVLGSSSKPEAARRAEGRARLDAEVAGRGRLDPAEHRGDQGGRPGRRRGQGHGEELGLRSGRDPERLQLSRWDLSDVSDSSASPSRLGDP